MGVYAVSYDLSKPGQEYTALIEELKASPGWWHHLQSTWLISTTESPLQIWKRLKPHLDENDRMLIIEVLDNTSGWLPKKAWEWIHQHAPEKSSVVGSYY